MYKRTITEREAGQRFDKYLRKLLPEAGSGFLYKMLRKKNIVLNDKKADGSEKLVCGDAVTVYFSDETLHKFIGNQKIQETHGRTADVSVIYENAHILIADKPAGMLTQKAAPEDFSLNDWLINYMLVQNQITETELQTFKPSACNRLDRNTSGIVLCAKSVQGAQMLSEALRSRSLHKFYMLYVKGLITEEKVLEGYLIKDGKSNKVEIDPKMAGMVNSLHKLESVDIKAKDSRIRDSKLRDSKSGDNKSKDIETKNSKTIDNKTYICTKYTPIRQEKDKTLLEVELITGKPHQIRAHLASIGHPLLGDYKYGDRAWNDEYRRKFNVKHQLLHAYKVVFGELHALSLDIGEREFIAPLPKVFDKVADRSSPMTSC